MRLLIGSATTSRRAKNGTRAVGPEAHGLDSLREAVRLESRATRDPRPTTPNTPESMTAGARHGRYVSSS